MNKAMAAAYRKGVQARVEGKGKDTCPYNPNQVTRGGPTFARAFWRCWIQGWEEQDQLNALAR